MLNENLCKYELPHLFNFSSHVKSKFGNDFGASLSRLKELSPKCRTKKKSQECFLMIIKTQTLGVVIG